MIKHKRMGANRLQNMTAGKEKRNQTLHAISRKAARPVLWGFAFIAVSAAVLFSAHYGIRSLRNHSLLQVQAWTVKGLQEHDRSEIIKAISLVLPKFFLDVRSTEIERQLEKISWVKKAEIKRRWIKNIEINITERRPFAFAKIKDSVWLADTCGFLFPVLPGTLYDLPLISGMVPQGANPNRVNPVLWSKVQKTIYDLKASDPSLYPLVSELSAGQESWCLYTITGTRILLPASADSSRFAQLALLLDDWMMNGKKANEIDFTFNHVAYIR
jgi:cell division septal protein FtsQ